LNLVDLLWSLSEKDPDELATVLMRMSVAFKPVDEAASGQRCARSSTAT
jgi:hypothetical protein